MSPEGARESPRDNYFHLTWDEKLLMTERIEIDITEECDLSCPACVRSCWQAPSRERMSVGQVEAFVQESIELRHHWAFINVIGGEPTLHPDLLAILAALKRFVDFDPWCRVGMTTHGQESAERVLAEIPAWVQVESNREAKKRKDASHFLPFNVAPIDVGAWDDSDLAKCARIFACGMGLTRHGYFHCHNAGGIHRVLRIGHGIQRLKDATFENLNRMIPLFCRYCGIYFEAGDRYRAYDLRMMTESWRSGYERYRRRGPP
jgi:hypothetical protein